MSNNLITHVDCGLTQRSRQMIHHLYLIFASTMLRYESLYCTASGATCTIRHNFYVGGIQVPDRTRRERQQTRRLCLDSYMFYVLFFEQ